MCLSKSFELTDEEGKMLIKLARSAVETFLKTGQTIKSPKDIPQKFYEKCGVFVTINILNKDEKVLRGCIGYPYPSSLLVEAIIDSAISAAVRDPRFSSMSLGELDGCIFDVSVLTPPELIQVGDPREYLQQVKVGQDGLIVERGYSKGLLLPQVPVEWQWNVEEFLCQCCMKAGLPSTSWLTKEVKIYKFSAIIFEEQTQDGEVKRLELICR
jgi:uncharacterized protein (TIGR00296 family)